MYIEPKQIEGRTPLGSGTFITFRNMPYQISIRSPHEPEAEPLELVFAFIDDDEEDTKPGLTSSLVGNLLTLTFTNHKNILGSGTGRPVRLGGNPIADLYGHFRINAFDGSEGDKAVTYSFYELLVEEPKEDSSTKKRKKNHDKE